MDLLSVFIAGFATASFVWFSALAPISNRLGGKIPGYRGIWHDGASHYYIDGNVMENGRVLVLRYDEATGRYSGEGLE